MARAAKTAPKASPLYARIRQILESARASAARSVNTTQVIANWLIGREIVEEEQRGHRRAGYGEALIVDLARRLTAEYGQGYSKDNLFWFRRLYQGYPKLVDVKFEAPRQISDALPGVSMSATPRDAPPPIRHAVRNESWQPGVLHPNLSWTHYRTLLRVDKPEARAFYEIESVKDNWAARELERQINSLLYERLALSRDKRGLMRLAVKGHEVQKSTDLFKDPVVMEFLGLPESPRLVETDLEQALINNLRTFLLELGKGFAFVARQERLTLEGDHFYIDLVFYHTILKCFVIVELKTGKLTHQDLGQLQLYVNYYDRERRTEGDNPTLGLILCTDKNETVVRYTLGPDQQKTIFASRYKLHLPTEAELRAELQREVRALRARSAWRPGMNRHVNAIAGRLSLRPPQRRSLEILDRITEIAPPKKGVDLQAALDAIRSEHASVTDFEREFPSLCFALATGVGKTRLMGAFISYLHLAHGFSNFFVLAPNLRIYNKLTTDFTPNTPKYVFKGIAEFSTEPPVIITGDTYEQGAGVRSGMLPGYEHEVHVNIFNISKINSEVRGGKSPRIKRLSEYIGQSYFDYLAGLEDLVLIMDESHRYRASAGVRAINELKPVLGLELTATPFVETSKGPVPFKNVTYDYPLGRAMADGFVKEPAVVTRKNFNPAGMSSEEIERLKLEDGVRLHESVKVDLETYARESGNAIVKPFLLVIARDTTHAGQLDQLIRSDGFFEGRYKDKVIQVDSSKTGAEEDEMIERLLRLEHTDEPTEIVIHVNMLKEGWDVTNLYTIVPLRAANARILIEQSIGRGLRLPYGRRAGVTAVDRLNIVAHDRFQEIIDEANRPDSAIRIQAVALDPDNLGQRTVTVVSQSQLASKLGLTPEQVTSSTIVAGTGEAPVFTNPDEQKVAQIAYDVIRKLENQPQKLPTVSYLQRPEIQAAIVQEVAAQYRPTQLAMEAIVEAPDIAQVVAKTAEFVTQQTISIPRILVVPTGEVKSGFRPLQLRLETLRYPAVSEELWVQFLRTGGTETVALGRGGIEEARLEDYIVSGLVDFDDISYDDHADLLYDLAAQTVRHFKTYLSEDDTRKVLRCYQRDIARFIHAQMQEHYWEDAAGYEVKISKGFTELKPSAYSAVASETPLNFRQAPADKSNMGRHLYGGFRRCLYPVQKFQSDPEHILAIILDRDALRWFRPAKGQFQIFYRKGADHLEYQPDFVAENGDTVYMLEAKRRNEMDTEEVEAKKTVAVQWCRQASQHALTYGVKPWRYVLIPHDVIAENMTLEVLARQYVVG